MLQYHLEKLGVTAQEALMKQDRMYNVYLRNERKEFEVARTVTITKKQEEILKAVDKKLANS